MPEFVLEIVHADMGIYGDGEEASLLLAQALIAGEDISTLPNIVYQHGERWSAIHGSMLTSTAFQKPRRRLFNNRKYEQTGAMVGIETKRGCAEACIFCADPVAKGRKARVRPPALVVQELQELAEQGISWLHIVRQRVQPAYNACQRDMPGHYPVTG